MTGVERVLLDEVRGIRGQVTEVQVAVGRLDERMHDLDHRMQELEERTPATARHPKSRTMARDGGLVISGGTVLVILNFLVTHYLPGAPAPAPTHIEAPK